MNITTVYFVRVVSSEASGYGTGTIEDPFRILPGDAGNTQLNALVEMIEAWQGTPPTTTNTLSLNRDSSTRAGFFLLQNLRKARYTNRN